MSDWPKTTLQEAGITLLDCDHKTPKAQEQGLPYVGIPQLKDGRITLEGARLISEEDFIHWRRKAKPSPNDVILSRRCNPGETAYVPEQLEIALGQNLVLLRNDGTRVHPKFLRWIVKTRNWWHQVDKYINVGAVFDSLKCADIPKFEITLPPLDSQVGIDEILSSIDRRIELNQEINQTLEQIAQAIFKSWFVDFEPVKAKQYIRALGGTDEQTERAAQAAIAGVVNLDVIIAAIDLSALDQQLVEALNEKLAHQTEAQRKRLATTASHFPDQIVESELGLIPKGWLIGSVGDLFELHRGFDLPKTKRVDGEYPVYAAGGFHGTHKEYKIEPPGVITGRSGVIGNVYLTQEKFWPLNTTLYVRDFRRCGPYYAYCFLKTCDLERLNSGSAVPSLNRNFVHSIKTVLPSKISLDRFEDFAKSVFEKMAHLGEESLSLENIRDSLIPKLLSGELSVSESNQNYGEVV